jgi:hypothetical protein
MENIPEKKTCADFPVFSVKCWGLRYLRRIRAERM